MRLACFDGAMVGFHSMVKYWLPVFLWAALIFSASTGAMSVQRTSRFIGPFLRWLKPDISAEAIRQIQLGVRKTAHLAEYAVFSMLLWRAQRKPRREDDRPWSWEPARRALLISFLYALSDEMHQWLVPSRGAHFGDVLLDTAGAACGLAVIWAWGRWMKKRW